MISQKDAYKDHVWIETPYGEFHVDNPVFDLRDIAHSLARVPRYNGHTKGAPYSVAEHSMLVAALMQHFNMGDPFEGLMHDALEAYIVDVPAPFKNLLPDYVALDKKLDTALRKQFKLPLTKTPECKKADEYALWLEAYEMMPSKGKTWPNPNSYREVALQLHMEGWRMARMDWVTAEQRFFTAAHEEARSRGIIK
jgi:hypothetical protein